MVIIVLIVLPTSKEILFLFGRKLSRYILHGRKGRLGVSVTWGSHATFLVLFCHMKTLNQIFF